MCEEAITAALQSKVQRLKSMHGLRYGTFLGYKCILVSVAQVIVVYHMAVTGMCGLIRNLQLATSAIWFDMTLTTGMKYIQADPSIYPSGFLAQSIVAFVAGTLLARSKTSVRDASCNGACSSCLDISTTQTSADHTLKQEATRPLSDSDQTWIVGSAAIILATMLLHRACRHTLDSIGYNASAAIVLLTWISLTIAACMIDMVLAYCTAFSLSFITPVLAEAMNPAHPDLPQLCASPSFGVFVLLLGHTGVNSMDRVFFALTDPVSLSVPDQLISVSKLVAAKVSILLIGSILLRWLLARMLDRPICSSNALLLTDPSAETNPRPATAMVVMIA